MFYLFWISIVVGCGKQETTAQHDDINSGSPIVYSGGWGGAQINIQLSVEIVDENQANPSFQSIVPQIQYAVDAWNNAIGKTVLILNTQSTLSQTGNTLLGCSGISDKLYYPLCYPFKGIFYDRVSAADISKSQSQWSSGWIYNTGKSAGVLATTVWNSSGSRITSANIRFNRDTYIFGDTTIDSNYYEDGTLKTIVDMRSVMLHELGHLLGLGHTSSEINSVMYPTMNIGPDKSNPNYGSGVSSTMRTLSACDVNRVQHIYANVPLSADCQ